ncbi:type VI secretion-associated protein, family [Tritonibacter multivorans]|uniref:Type VI secretion-associated protein, family n=1 Tax=Tritonibacter multivorans TaxID=928856 RepID=A0A0P1GEZ8_9RHOB|nr:type VI secretion system-associated protein TagF [Tritonibacter multivorans]MDA7423022.1 type VI secretion system-associated protein TagF [Tritonibacter multivorans]CUH75067.1 type VI secretion-associated protein, family [Tritonibacter multivorans]SFD77410.1 type VI secretion system protein ImpM [Tritonibacter multivorans]
MTEANSPPVVSAVLYGKHRAFGDFLAHGLDHQHLAPLDAWLEAVLPELRSRLGERWEAAWAAAPPLCFWIGPSLLGVPLCGVFMTSADRVGRRFPLVFGLAGVVTPPPVDDTFSPAPYGALWAHIAGFRLPEEGLQGAATLLEGFEPPALEGSVWDAGSDGTLWGQRGDGDLGRLFADARRHDAAQAQFTRSHWWQEHIDGREAGWLACNGLPDAEALEWLLTARATEGETA